MPLAPDAAALVARLNLNHPDLGGEVRDAAEARRLMARRPPLPSAPVPIGSVRDRVIAGPRGTRLRVRVYRPSDPPPRAAPVVVYLHGGGWVFGDLDTHDSVARRMANGARAVVVSVDYRRAPEHPFPAALHDTYAALRWSVTHACELGGDPAAVAVAGDSAGANLAAAAALMAADLGGPSIAFQLLIYPVTDHDFGTVSYLDPHAQHYLSARQMRWYWDQYVPVATDRDHPYAAPLRAPSLRGLPSAHIVTAECDPLRAEGRRYAVALAEAGVDVSASDWPGAFHGFFRYPDLLPLAAEAVGATHAVLETALSAT